MVFVYQREGLHILQVTIKYALDRFISVVLTLLISPLIGLIAANLRVVDGKPIFFRQNRLGKDGKQFRVWKFRTMVVDADDFLDDRGVPTKVRTTDFGRFLRQTSLDELPNLFNIVTGDMSFIGPRPTLPSHLQRYSPEQRRRFRMRPGITGLAQIRGRNDLPWSERLRLDNEYIDRYSLLLDVKILVRTVKTVLLREGVQADRNPQVIDDLAPPWSTNG